MLLCYLDEAGEPSVLASATSPVQPLFCILALTLPAERLQDFTLEFIDLKHRFFPHKFTPSTPRLSRLMVEIKGSDLRAAFRSADTRLQRHHVRLFRELFALLQRHECRVFGRVWVKPIGGPMDGKAVYTYSVQDVCRTFHHLLHAVDRRGFIIADARAKRQNTNVSFSVFTQQFGSAGNPYSRLVETPTFGHSDNHAGLQVSDWLCSGLVFPIAAYSYCTGHVTNLHVHPGYQTLKIEFGAGLEHLQHRYLDPGPPPKWRGGIVTNDQINMRPGRVLFR